MTSATLELSENIAKYAEIGNSNKADVNGALTVKLKAGTVSIANSITGFAVLKITDTWGAVTEVKCPITLKADNAK